MPTLATRPIRQTPKRRRRLSTRAKIALALLGSLLLHVVLLFVLGWVVPHWPHAKLRGTPPPIHLTFTSPPKPAPPAPNATGSKPEYVRTLEEQRAEHQPDNPNFISDRPTLAASELPATGDKPLPTQEGKQIPAYDFDTRPYRPGKEANDAASAAPAAPPPPDQPKKTPDTKKPAPHSKALHPPKPPSTPKPAGEIASMADASPTPEPPTPAETPDEASAPPVPRQSQQRPSANPSVNSPGLPHPPGYQPETIKSKVTGGISNRGKTAVAARDTPLGHYQKAVEDAIGMLWYQYTEARMDVLGAGEVKLHFFITRSGKVESVRVSSGKQNSALADISIQAVSEAPIPPIPPDIVDTLDGGQLEYDFGFGVY